MGQFGPSVRPAHGALNIRIICVGSWMLLRLPTMDGDTACLLHFGAPMFGQLLDTSQQVQPFTMLKATAMATI